MNLRTPQLIAILLLALTTAALAVPDSPGPATVCVARADHILVPPGISAPKVLYPQGRVDYDVVERLVDSVMECLTGKQKTDAWRAVFSGTDRVGIMVEVGRYPVQLATVETVIDRLVNAGINPSNIVVFSADERDLFLAGFNVSRDPKSVRVMGTEAEGFRGGATRIALDYCDALIDIGSLQVDPEIGFMGCLSNTLVCVPTPRRVELRRDPSLLGSAGALPVMHQKLRLNLLEAYLPLLDTVGKDKVTWQYGGLLAGTDPVAVDVVGRQVLQGCRNASKGAAWPLPGAVDYLRPAQAQYNLGQSDRKLITIKMQGNQTDSFLD
jgi:hypothetical protein